ncbi:MAG: 4-hydroxy-3-methylbut-2-enyl diphosphate reductase [Puniceicoccales bacterium]|jgi:4-hydroxy-3-methylbut-2-enyl diphosphate reductase|nr:4-hydroxy-3-methylbut-2-enyl diphosphate reductase [Puniceicoccales bacterium]
MYSPDKVKKLWDAIKQTLEKMTRKIIRCRSGGFCDGVSRAVGMALRANASGLRVHMDGELVHNSSVTQYLLSHGICIWDGSSREWRSDECLLIRAHGISLERRELLRKLGCRLCDATCPHVARIGGKISQFRRMGYFIILYGDERHPEILGLKSYGGDSIHVLSSVEQLTSIPCLRRCPHIAILSQTTASSEDFQFFASAVAREFPWIEIFDSICEATRIRQMEIDGHIGRGQCDGAIVVGSPHSSNAKKLADKFLLANIPVAFVENLEDLQNHHVLPGDGTILLTGGTSTPPWEIDAIESYLRQIQ